MNCLFSKPQRGKLELMGTKVQNKGGGRYLSCSPFSPSPDSVASSQSLLSSSFLRHSPTPVVSISSTVSHLQCGKVQLEMFLKQTTLL